MTNTATTKRYKVWADRPRYFDSLAAAIAHADRIYRRSGDVVAITEVGI